MRPYELLHRKYQLNGFRCNRVAMVALMDSGDQSPSRLVSMIFASSSSKEDELPGVKSRA